MGNPYLESLQTRYASMEQSVQGLLQRAADEGRDLTADELRSVKEQGDQMKDLSTQIEDLGDIEQRNAAVAKVAALVTNGQGETSLEPVGDGQTQTRGVALGITAQERDPGHYTRSSQHSFFADLYRSRTFDDQLASQRLVDHQRGLQLRAGLTTGANGPGVVPPNWLTQEFTEIPRQGRALANSVRPIPLGDDPRPLTLPKQITGTDTAVTDQAAEGNALADANTWDSDVDTVAPKPLAGKQLLSRQLLDMSSPAIDQLVYGDLLGVYDQKVEAKVGTAVKAVGTSLVGIGGGTTAPQPGALTEAEFVKLDQSAGPTDNGSDLAIRAAIAVRKNRHQNANILAMSVDRYGKYLQLKDTTGRPLIPMETAGPMNVVGVGSVQVDGRIHGMGVVATDGMGDGSLPDTFAAVHASDVLLFESNMLRFRFEEQAGPENIVLGIWGYVAVLVRQGTRSVQIVTITA